MSNTSDYFDRAVGCIDLLNDHIMEKIELTPAQMNICARYITLQSKNDIFFFAKYVLGFDLMTEQTHKVWCNDLKTAFDKRIQRMMRLKPRATYKCLKKGTDILPLGINEDTYEVENVTLKNQRDFIEPGIKVTLKSGRSVICTKDHPFMTIRGWEEAREGLRVGVARELPSPYVPVDEAEEYLMGLLVGDGCLRGSTPRLSCNDSEIIDKIKEYGFQIGAVFKNGLDYSILKFHKQIKEAGLLGTNSHTKFIPKKYEGSPHFLRGLFDADGSIAKRDPRFIFVTVSEQLADDVLRNLLYFGIVGRKRYYEYPATDKSPEVKCYQISVYGDFIHKLQKTALYETRAT